ncbi:MAG: hypothetical protein ACUZ8H_02210 [Candidatus Anammoxibacter sp.]
MNEIITLPVVNPFSDKPEDVLCKFQLIIDNKGKTKHAVLLSAMTKEDVDLMKWCSIERLEEIEQEYMEAVK